MDHRGCSRIVYGVLDLISVLIFDNFGCNKEQLQPCDSDCIGCHRLQRGHLFSALTDSGQQLDVAPDVIGQDHQLKKCIIVLELGRWYGLKPFAFGLTNQVFNIGAFIILADHFMGRARKTRAEYPVCIVVVLKECTLHLLVWSQFVFRYAHGYKTARSLPTDGLIDAAVIRNILALPRTTPTRRIEGRVASFVGDNEVIAAANCGLDTFPALELPIGPQQDLLDTDRQLKFGLKDKGGGLLTANRFAFSKLSDKAFPGLLNEAQHRPVALLATVFGVVTFTAALLIAVDCLHGGVDIDADPVIPAVFTLF